MGHGAGCDVAVSSARAVTIDASKTAQRARFNPRIERDIAHPLGVSSPMIKNILDRPVVAWISAKNNVAHRAHDAAQVRGEFPSVGRPKTEPGLAPGFADGEFSLLGDRGPSFIARSSRCSLQLMSCAILSRNLCALHYGDVRHGCRSAQTAHLPLQVIVSCSAANFLMSGGQFRL